MLYHTGPPGVVVVPARQQNMTSYAVPGYERALAGASVPWVAGTAIGLDVLDPILYQALVAEQVARHISDEIIVREVRYSNPFSEVVTGVGAAQKAVKATAGVIETAATLGSRRKLKKLELGLQTRPLMTRLRA